MSPHLPGSFTTASYRALTNPDAPLLASAADIIPPNGYASDTSTRWTVGPDGWLRARFDNGRDAVIVPPRGPLEAPMLAVNDGTLRMHQGSHNSVLTCMEVADAIAAGREWRQSDGPAPHTP